MSIRKILAARGKTHGDFGEHARITQALKDVMHASDGWARLNSAQRESLEMNVHKVGRILAVLGERHDLRNCGRGDHWADIAGYAQLVADRLPDE